MGTIHRVKFYVTQLFPLPISEKVPPFWQNGVQPWPAGGLSGSSLLQCKYIRVIIFLPNWESQLAFFILQHLIPPHTRHFCQSAGGVPHPVSDVVRYEVRHKSLLCIFTSLSMLLQNFPGPVKPIVQLYACSYCRDLRCHMEVSQSLLKKPVLLCKWTQIIWVIIL